jgi:ABC-type multidrug transport system fused ATPase/permease subunit
LKKIEHNQATSALDTKSEAAVQAALDRLGTLSL